MRILGIFTLKKFLQIKSNFDLQIEYLPNEYLRIKRLRIKRLRTERLRTERLRNEFLRTEPLRCFNDLKILSDH